MRLAILVTHYPPGVPIDPEYLHVEGKEYEIPEDRVAGMLRANMAWLPASDSPIAKSYWDAKRRTPEMVTHQERQAIALAEGVEPPKDQIDAAIGKQSTRTSSASKAD